MDKAAAVKQLLDGKPQQLRDTATASAPTNIALCKYWGKRDTVLNLPVTSSLSIALPEYGATTTLSLNNEAQDSVSLNNKTLAAHTPFSQRLSRFLDLFRPTHDTHFHVRTESTIPVAAGLASSACGFAALVKALNQLFAWQLTEQELSILARLGSGSACRSIWPGFVEWQAGDDSQNSHGIPLNAHWPTLRIGILLLSTQEKAIPSRQAMQITCETSPFYPHWPALVEQHLQQLKAAITACDITALGTALQNNSQAMHALMHTSQPSIIYSNADTWAAMQQLLDLQADGLRVYFTQDAGANLVLFFEDSDSETVRHALPQLKVSHPF